MGRLLTYIRAELARYLDRGLNSILSDVVKFEVTSWHTLVAARSNGTRDICTLNVAHTLL